MGKTYRAIEVSETGVLAARAALQEATSMNEASLLAAAKNGETAAFDTLCRAHAEKLFRTVHRITRNREDAEDAVQDSLLRAFLHLKSFDGKSTFSTWLTRIGINSALMLLRKRRSWREIYIDDSVEPGGNWSFCDVPDSSPNPESFCLQREREEALRQAIGDLRPKTRSVIELGRLQERSMKQTARVMGISTAAAKARLFHARRMLRSSEPLRTVGRALSTGRASGHALSVGFRLNTNWNGKQPSTKRRLHESQ